MSVSFLVVLVFSFTRTILGVHIFKLGYRVTPERVLTAPDYDGLIFVSSQPLNDSTIPEPIKEALTNAAKGNGALESEGGVVEVNVPSGRMVFVPTGPISNYQHVHSFGEAGKKGIERALKANIKEPLLVLHPDPHSNFPHAELVTLLGALEALYVDLQHREKCPDKCPRMKNLGVWGPEYPTLVDIVNIAVTFEDGRIVTRDITGGDSERMSPTRVEEYIREVFPPESGVNISVVSDPQILQKDYPLFSAVNRPASGVEKHTGRIIFLTYQSPTPVQETVLLVGKGVTYDTGGANTKASTPRDKGGAAAVVGFMKVLADTKVGGLKVVAAMPVAQNSISEGVVADEVITSRSGRKVRVVKTDVEGRMVMADLLCKMKELVEKREAAINPHIISIATLTGHAGNSVGTGYGIVVDNGPAAQSEEGRTLKLNGDKIGEPLQVGILQNQDFEAYKGDDLVQTTEGTSRRQEAAAAFLITASGLDKHGLDSSLPIKYSHMDMAVPNLPDPVTAAPLLALANRFIMRIEDPPVPGIH